MINITKFLIVLLFIVWTIVSLVVYNKCTYKPIVQPHDYQIDITDSGAYIYNKNYCIGFVPFDSSCAWNKLFIEDKL